MYTSSTYSDIRKYKDIRIETFDALASDEQLEIAQAVSGYTLAQAEQHKIVPVTPQSILEKQIAHVAFDKEVLVGFVGADEPIAHNGFNMPQVGTLCVWPEYRGSSTGQRLVDSLTWALMCRGQLSYAFCNPRSLKVFKKAQYVEASPDELPAGVSSPYGNQAMIHHHAPRRAMRNAPLRLS